MESAATCLKFEERPTTPHAIRKYRKSYFSEPGKRVTHFGSIDDELNSDSKNKPRRSRKPKGKVNTIDEIFCRGKKGASNDSISSYINDKKEAIYRRNQREPLGKPYIRGHHIPEVEERTAKMNANNAGCTEGAKDLIYANGNDSELQDEEKFRDRYIKSHGSYAPGQQRKRSYNWKKIDPKTHCFGVTGVTANTNEGVSQCIQHQISNQTKSISTITMENFKKLNSDQLGKSRSRGIDIEASDRCRERTQNKVEKEWSAEESIQGNYSVQEQMPDQDLGKATRPGWRNNTSISRRFGCPTVRNDIPKPKRRSVGDDQNYGDDTNAAKLLYPSRFSELGVDDFDFAEAKDKNEVRDTFSNIGYDLNEEEFEKMFQRAKHEEREANNKNSIDSQKVSIDLMRKVLNERLDALDAGYEPAWW